MYILVNNQGSIELYAEESDACYLCTNMSVCPLMESLQNEIVVLRYDEMNVENCGMFEEFSEEEIIGDCC